MIYKGMGRDFEEFPTACNKEHPHRDRQADLPGLWCMRGHLPRECHEIGQQPVGDI